MTPAQKARLAGWNASLKQRGVLLKLQRTGTSYNAIANDVEAVPGQYSLSAEERDDSFVSMLRDDLGTETIVVGDSFLNEETGATYRVTRSLSRPSDLIVRWKCEAAL